ncbi:hypothetical protein KFE98_13030 [bacterium SCSIO 12741]|nr:hypothetical protein KFE98_13030 [bacterium SCSIO 12741]
MDEWLHGDQELIHDTLVIYQQEILSYIYHLSEALEKKDYDRLFFMLHKMTSPILLFHMDEANKCVGLIESQKNVEVKDAVLIKTNLDRLEEILRRSLVEVEVYLKQHS